MNDQQKTSMEDGNSTGINMSRRSQLGLKIAEMRKRRGCFQRQYETLEKESDGLKEKQKKQDDKVRSAHSEVIKTNLHIINNGIPLDRMKRSRDRSRSRCRNLR
jgi:hypothetical protein